LIFAGTVLVNNGLTTFAHKPKYTPIVSSAPIAAVSTTSNNAPVNDSLKDLLGMLLNGLNTVTTDNKPKKSPTTSPTAIDPSQSAHKNKKTLPYSTPISIRIPSIDVKSDIMQLDKKSDGSLEVPLGKNINKTGWYKNSPTPGQVGASIITGHLDQYDGSPSSFFRLGEVKAGATIHVQRKNGDTVSFVVTDKQKVYKNNFPTDKIYNNPSSPTLHLITCGGAYDTNLNDYDSNIIVTAVMK